MPDQKSPKLTPLETLIMDVLWEHAPAGVRQVQERLEKLKPMAYNTVLTMMRILREKGFLTSERVGRIDVYSPVVSREQVGKHSLRELLTSFFYDSPGERVSRLIDAEEISEEELKSMRREIDRKLRSQASEKGGAK